MVVSISSQGALRGALEQLGLVQGQGLPLDAVDQAAQLGFELPVFGQKGVGGANLLQRGPQAERRRLLSDALDGTGLVFEPPEATFYFWIGTPHGEDSIRFCRTLLDETGIVATPGIGFGEHGEGFFRLSLTAGTETVREAGELLEGYLSRSDKR